MGLQLGFTTAAASGEVQPSPSSSFAAPAEPTTLTAPAFSGTGSATLSGTRTPGNAVVVTAAGRTVCSIPAGDNPAWSCSATRLPNGGAIELTATETPAVPTDVTPAPASATIAVLSPPVLDGNGAYLTTGLVSGTGNPGSVVSVLVAGVVDPNCARVPVSSQSYWSCSVAAEGGPLVVRAQQSDAAIGGGQASAFSNVQNITVDRIAPEPAVIVSPAPGTRVDSQPIEIRGTAESGGTVDVYVDTVPVCSTTTSASGWSCTIGGMAAGDRSIVVIQRDAAGNFAAPSSPLIVTVAGEASATPTPTSPTPAPTTAPPTPQPGEPETPGTPTPEVESTPSPSDAVPGPQGGTPTTPDLGSSNWSAPTDFGRALVAFSGADARGPWWVPAALGLLFVGLVAVPLRMLATALRGRVPVRAAPLTGRNNHRRADDDTPSAVNPWLAGAVPLGLAAVFIAVSSGVDSEVRYVRLLLAIVIGLVILNVVGGAIATRLGAMAASISTRLRFMPVMLGAAVGTALVSRAAELDPPVIAGVLIGAAFVPHTDVRRRAAVSIAQIGSVAALGVVGWVGHGLVGAPSGFASALVSETLATICLAGLGSALVLALPIASLPGRVVLEWSAPIWATVMLVVSATAASIVLVDVPAAQLTPWAIAAASFAALSAAVWTYMKFVAPTLAR